MGHEQARSSRFKRRHHTPDGRSRDATRTIRLHDVIRSYLQKAVGDRLPALHSRLLDAYALKRWADLPGDEPYLWDHCAGHLVAAGRLAELIATVKDLRYLARKTRLRSAYAAEADLALLSNVKGVLAPPLKQFSQGPTDYGAEESGQCQRPPALLGVRLPVSACRPSICNGTVALTNSSSYLTALRTEGGGTGCFPIASTSPCVTRPEAAVAWDPGTSAETIRESSTTKRHGRVSS